MSSITTEKRFAVIGAGTVGLTAAYQILNEIHGARFDVYEAEYLMLRKSAIIPCVKSRQ
jgi:predicted NAD/FAD-binding protein